MCIRDRYYLNVPDLNLSYRELPECSRFQLILTGYCQNVPDMNLALQGIYLNVTDMNLIVIKVYVQISRSFLSLRCPNARELDFVN